jgi:8-oxo-dGTP pyrophosphatase MutT (NUDIX family)
MQSCCSLRLLPSFYQDDSELFNIVRTRRTGKIKRIRSGSIIIDRHTKKILIIQSYKRFWGLPKGHVEENESLEECAIRETQEETGIELRTQDLLRSFSIYNGDGVYFLVDGSNLEYDLENLTSKNEITGITWICLSCLEQFTRTQDMLINSHLRALLPTIRKELYMLES